ncbi:MAG: PH domain-containing protein [Candidatus Uhrbacteria bacterium]
MKNLNSVPLRPGEKIIEVVRQDFFPSLPWWFFLFLWIVVPFFFLFPLWQQGWVGIIIFAGLVLSGLLVASQSYFSWQRTSLVITDQRIIDIDQHGFFNRSVTEIEHQDIEEVAFKIKGFWSTVFRFGTVLVRTAGERADVAIRRVHQPIKLQHLLNDLREEIGGPGVFKERARKLASLAGRLSNEEIERLAAAVEKRESKL